ARDEAEADRLRAKEARRAGRGLDIAGIAEHQVVARTRGDRVAVRRSRDDNLRRAAAGDVDALHQLAVLAADDDVVARAGGDRVVAAVVGLGREDAVDVRGVAVIARQRGARRRRDSGVEAADIARGPVDVARVADHDVATFTGGERVAVDTAQQDVGSEAGRNAVRTADQRLDGFHE